MEAEVKKPVFGHGWVVVVALEVTASDHYSEGYHGQSHSMDGY
jgi:hypothetical protein